MGPKKVSFKITVKADYHSNTDLRFTVKTGALKFTVKTGPLNLAARRLCPIL